MITDSIDAIRTSRSWTNFHGTITNVNVPDYFTPKGTGDEGMLKPQADAISKILQYCFEKGLPLRTMGTTWSLSNIVKITGAALDMNYLNFKHRVDDWLTDERRKLRPPQDYMPVFAQGGATIRSIHEWLAKSGSQPFALQTTGASDGHKIAGCIATGTHGSALKIGAVHDTVLAIHLIVAPNKSYFLQPATSPALNGDTAAQWLEEKTGLPTSSLLDDELFYAALVSLGSLGVVFGVVLETVPLYEMRLKQFTIDYDPDSQEMKNVMQAMSTLHTSQLDPESDPYHFDVILHPYPEKGKIGAVVKMLWKRGTSGRPPWPEKDSWKQRPGASSDLIAELATVSQIVEKYLPDLFKLALQAAYSKYVFNETRYPKIDENFYPFEIFCPTDTPPGHGASTEIVVDQERFDDAIKAIYKALNDQAEHHSRYMLGGIGVRFGPQTKALLGMSANPMNAYIEMPGINNESTAAIYKACWSELANAKVPFTCHWGQMHGMTRESIDQYFGKERVASWSRARARLLQDPVAQKVFASPILAEVGLDQ